MGYEAIARWYDRLYSFKDYRAEAAQIRDLVAWHGARRVHREEPPCMSAR